MIPILRLVHPAPAVAVILLSAALGTILLAQAGSSPLAPRLLLVIVAVGGSQVFTGALNDWADRARDAVAQPNKPIPSGQVSPGTALGVAMAGLFVQVAGSAPLGAMPLVLGVVASGSAAAYDLWLSRTPASVVPYLVSFGVLPLWIASGVGVPLERVALAPLLVGPFAAAAHLANTLRDYEGDAALGSRSLAQWLGRRRAFVIAWLLAMGTGVSAGVVAATNGVLEPLVALLGMIGLGAVVAPGLRGPERLWPGMLVAAVAWTAAWAFATG